MHAPELAEHESKKADIKARIAEARDTFEQADRALAKLGAELRELEANPPWIPPSPYPDGRPLKVEDDSRDRRRRWHFDRPLRRR